MYRKKQVVCMFLVFMLLKFLYENCICCSSINRIFISTLHSRDVIQIFQFNDFIRVVCPVKRDFIESQVFYILAQN